MTKQDEIKRMVRVSGYTPEAAAYEMETRDGGEALDLTFTAIRYHRNGCCGAGFYVVRFTYRDAGESPCQLQAVVFDQAEHVAVTSADLHDCWRGDWFEPQLRAYIASDEAQSLAFAA